MGREALRHTLFPLAGLEKPEVREYAKQCGLPVSDKPESQDVCFVPRGNTHEFVSRHTGRRRGEIVLENGTVVGEHDGVAGYTIGQRKGLGVAAGKPMYVLAVDPDKNRVIIGEEERLKSAGLEAGQACVMADALPKRCCAKIRYAHTAVPCSVETTGSGFRVMFDTPQKSITPGQSVVLYDGDTVAGGGIIERAVAL
jgi:tRNA-specific 2-thiouridylase